MKWNIEPIEHGQKRDVKRFAFLPKKVYRNADVNDKSQVKVWLESYMVKQQVEYDWASILADYRILKWVDKYGYALWP